MEYRADILDIYLYLANRIYDPFSMARIDLTGHIDADILKKAAALSLDAIPLLRCRFDDSRLRPRWVEKNFTGDDIVCCFDEDKSITIEEQLFGLCASGIDFRSGPQAKVYMISRAKGDTLCAIFNHMFGDGGGLKQFLYLLSALYTKLKNNAPVPAAGSYPRGAKLLLENLSFKDKLEMLRAKALNDKLNDYTAGLMGFFGDAGDRCEPYLETRNIPGDRFEQLKGYTKAKQVTINDLFMTAFARSFCKNRKIKELLFPATMDLRKYIPPDRNYGVGNYSVNCACFVTYGEDDPFGVTLMQVSEQMNRYKSDNRVLRDIVIWDIHSRLTPFWMLKRNIGDFKIPVISFTNVGIIDADSLHFDGLVIENAFISTRLANKPYIQFLISTWRDCLNVSCSYSANDAHKNWAKGLIDDFFNELANLG